jgi:hypothetical protein
MDWGVVLAALLTSIGGIITTILMRFRKENATDHATVMQAINKIGGNVERIDSKLGSHIDWHLQEASSGQVSNRGKKYRAQ